MDSIARIIAAFVLLLAVLSPASSAAPTKLLKGQIVVDELLPPVPPEFGTGSIFHPNLATSEQTLFYRIPKWLAGEWNLTDDVNVSLKDVKTERVRKRNHKVEYKKPRTGAYGCVKDKSGDIWGIAPFDKWRSTQRNGETQLFALARSGQVSQPDSDEFVVKSIELCVVVREQSKQIVDVYQCEFVQTFTKVSESRISCRDVTMYFDAGGKPQVEEVTDFEMLKVSPFEGNLDKRNAYKMPSFRVYLRANGLSNLEPHLSEEEHESVGPFSPD